MTADVTRCGAHPERLAVATCSRCGSFTCDDCVELFDDLPLCAGCHARPEVGGRTTTPAILTLLLALGGLFCGPPLAVGALGVFALGLLAVLGVAALEWRAAAP